MRTLHRNGVCFGAAPNRRTAVEYALFLFWLADSPDAAVDVLNRSLQNGQKLLATQVRRDNLSHMFSQETHDKVADTVAVQLQPHPDERLLKATHLIDQYGQGLKSWYATESRLCHPSLTSMQFFFQDQPESNSVHLYRDPMPQEPVPCLDVSFHILFRSTLAFNSLLKDAPLVSDLASVADDYGLDLQLPTRKTQEQPQA